jgi:hypothetical protein
MATNPWQVVKQEPQAPKSPWSVVNEEPTAQPATNQWKVTSAETAKPQGYGVAGQKEQEPKTLWGKVKEAGKEAWNWAWSPLVTKPFENIRRGQAELLEASRNPTPEQLQKLPMLAKPEVKRQIQTGVGISTGLTNFGESLTSPANIGMMAALGPLTSPKLEMFGFLNSMGLSAEGATSSIKTWMAARQAEVEGRTADATALKTEAVVNLLMALGFARHAVKGARGQARIEAGRNAAAVDRLRAGLNSAHLDADSLEIIRGAVQKSDLPLKEKVHLLNVAEQRARQMRPQGPLVAPIRPEAPAPGTLATGPFEAPPARRPLAAVRTVREQLNQPRQALMPAAEIAGPTQPLPSMPVPAHEPQISRARLEPSNIPPIPYEQAIQRPAPAIEPNLPIYPKAPESPQRPLPVTPPEAKIDYTAPMMDRQRRALFAVAGDRGISKDMMEGLAKKPISKLTVSEANDLMGQMRRITPEEIKAIKPLQTEPLLEQVKAAKQQPQPLPSGTLLERIRPKRKYAPEKSLTNAILSLGGINPEKIRRAGTWEEWNSLPRDVKMRVMRKSATSGPDDIASQLADLGYGDIRSENDLLEALNKNPKRGLEGISRDTEMQQLEAEYKRVVDELENLKAERKASEEEPDWYDYETTGEREPGQEGAALIQMPRRREIETKPEKFARLAKTLEYLKGEAGDWINAVNRRKPGLKREDFSPAERTMFDEYDRLMNDIQKELDSLNKAGEVLKFRPKGEEGFARFRDEKTKELFPGEFRLTPGTRPEERKPSLTEQIEASRRGLEGEKARRGMEQKSLLPEEPGPLFERKAEEPKAEARLPVATRDKIRTLQGNIAEAEIRLRSKVNAIGERLSQGELSATQRAADFAKNRIEELRRPTLAEEVKKAQEKPATTSGPFTDADIEQMNRFTNYPTDKATANARYSSEAMQLQKETMERLKRYGITEMPDDVAAALGRVNRASLNMTREFARAREVAPGAYIVGPSNYLKHARPERARAIEQKAVSEYDAAKEYLDRAIKRHSPNAPISSDKTDAPTLLQQKIDRAEKMQDIMRRANAVIRKAGLTKEQKISQLVEMGHSKAVADKLLEPDFLKRVGYPDYELRNNLANIKRMRERLAGMTKERATETNEFEFDGGKVVDSLEDNRIQIFYDSKPNSATIAKLKSNGFKWAPSIEAWQRQRTGNARYAADTMIGDKLSQADRHKLLHPTEAPRPTEEPTLKEQVAAAKVEKPRPVSDLAGQVAQMEVDRRALVAREAINRVIEGRGTWSQKRKQLDLPTHEAMFGRVKRFEDVPISKAEIESLVRRELADTVAQTGLKPTQPKAAGPQKLSLFGDDEGFARFKNTEFDKDPQLKAIFDRLERAERAERRAPFDILPKPGEADVPGAKKHPVSWIRSADQALARNPETAPIAREIKYAARDKKRAMQHYDDIANEIVRKYKIKKGSEEDRMVKDLLDESYTGISAQKLRDSLAYQGDKEAAISAAQRLRDEIFEPIINQIRNDPELVSIIGKRGYIRGYFPHYMEQMKAKYGKQYLGMVRAMLPDKFVSKFLKERESETWPNDVSIHDVVPAYISSTMKTVHDIPAYTRALKIIKGLPEGPARDFANWYADNYMGQPSAKEGFLVHHEKYQRFSRWVANRYYDNLIGLNYKTWAINLGQTVTNTYPELGAKYTRLGIKELFTKEGRRKFHESGLLFDYPGVESGILKEGIKRRILHGGMAGGEYVNRGIAYLGGLEQAKDMGLVGHAAEMHAMDVVDKTQFAYGKESAIRALENLPPDLRVFQTFPLKEAEFVRNLVVDAYKGGKAERAKLGRFIMINVGLPALLAVSGVNVGRMFIDITDIIPGLPRTVRLLSRLHDYCWQVRSGKVKVENIPLDIMKGLYDAFGPAANIGKQAGRELGLIEKKKRAQGARP